MKKIMHIVKNPVVIGTFAAFVMMVLCGIFSIKKPAAKHPEVVVEFCDTLVHYNQEDIIEQLRKTIRFKSEMDPIIKAFNELLGTKGVKVSYILGDVESNEGYALATGEPAKVCHAMLIISQKGEVINTLRMTFYVTNRDGKDVLVEFRCPELGV